jgi:hypothetical protein
MQQQAMDAFTAGHALANAAASMAAGNPLFAAHPTTSSAAILAAASAAQQQQQQQQRAAVAATLAAQQQVRMAVGQGCRASQPASQPVALVGATMHCLYPTFTSCMKTLP